MNIEKNDFANFIEGLREYKAFLTHSLGNWCDNHDGDIIDNAYYLLVEPFIHTTMDPILLNKLEMLSEADNNYELYQYELLEDFINYGYAYTIEFDNTFNEDLSPKVADKGILLSNITDFYNYWVYEKLPKNPVYSERRFSSKDSEKIAQKYINKLRDICYPNNFFII